MIKYRVGSHGIHNFVEALGRCLLKKRVLGTAASHPVNNVDSLQVLFNHLIHGINVILQIRIHGNNHVRIILCRHQSGKKSILMPPVSAEINSAVKRILLVKRSDYLPCPICGTVVHKKNPTALVYLSPLYQGSDLIFQPLRRFRQHLLFVVTGNHKI